jgi:hypothetical protein
MLSNLAIGSLIVAIFSGVCAYDAIKSVRMITLPLAYVALAAAVVLYGVTFLG